MASAENNLVGLLPPVTPSALTLALHKKFADEWRVKAVFDPSLDYEDAMTNFKTNPLATNDRRNHDPIDSVFAWRRSELRPIEGLGDSTEYLSYCNGGSTLDAAILAEFDIEYRAFFSSMKTLESFEIGYIAGQILRNVSSISVEHNRTTEYDDPVLEEYFLIWDDTNNLSYSMHPNFYISLDFKMTISGTFRHNIIESDPSIVPDPILTIHLNNHGTI